MSRTVIVGDVHGCIRELEDLLSYVGFRKGDRLVFVGDLVVRGPKPREVVALARALDALAVRGNHEDRLLRWRRSRRTAAPLKIGSVTRRAAEALKKSDWEFLEAMPMWLDLPEHNIRVVHAGVVPGVPIEEQAHRHLMYLRSLDETHPSELRGACSWAHAWEGPEHIVFGHNAQLEPEIARHATGLDTGVVYGGRLTAMVLIEDERPPTQLEERRRVLVSVPARRAYFVKPPKPPSDKGSGIGGTIGVSPFLRRAS